MIRAIPLSVPNLTQGLTLTLGLILGLTLNPGAKAQDKPLPPPGPFESVAPLAPPVAQRSIPSDWSVRQSLPYWMQPRPGFAPSGTPPRVGTSTAAGRAGARGQGAGQLSGGFGFSASLHASVQGRGQAQERAGSTGWAASDPRRSVWAARPWTGRPWTVRRGGAANTGFAPAPGYGPGFPFWPGYGRPNFMPFGYGVAPGYAPPPGYRTDYGVQK